MSATLLHSVLPPDAIKMRTGGDEFLVIIPHADEAALKSHLDQLNAAAKMFKIKDRALSVSFGGAIVHDPDTIKERITSADREMYRNKKAKESWM